MAGRPKVRKDLAFLSTITTGDADMIFERAISEPLYRVAASLNVGLTALHEWIDASPDRVSRLKRARERKAAFLADELLDIADGKTCKQLAMGKGEKAAPVGVTEAGQIQRDNLKIKTRMWLSSRLDRATYGDNNGPAVTINMNSLHLDSLRRANRAEPLPVVVDALPPSE